MSQIVGYIRVSTTKQAREGDSPEAQKERILDWAHTRDHPPETVQIFTDMGLSGKRADNRPGLQSALELVCRTKGTLVFYSLSRLARSVSDAVRIAERLRTAGADMASVTEPIDTTTSAGKLMFGLFALFAEFERDLAVERTLSVVQYKRDHSERIGQIPYGFKLCQNGKNIVVDAVEKAVVDTIVRLKTEGQSLQHIAEYLAIKRVPTKNGGPRWAVSTIATILIREMSNHAEASA